MQGVYLSTEGSHERVYAGFVVGVGWAHEEPQDRGAVEAVLWGLVGEPFSLPGLEYSVFVSPAASALLLAGPPDVVEAAGARIARRLRGEEALGEIREMPPVTSFDVDALWRRWGARSYGGVGLRPYFLRAPGPDDVTGKMGELLTSATVVPFGVDTPATAPLEQLREGRPFPAPFDEPIVPLPARAIASDGAMSLSWVTRPDERLADAIVTNALVPCFARPTPERVSVAVLRRDLGHAGTHTTLYLLDRAPQPGEISAVAEQLRRLRDHGPTETEIVRALDQLKPPDETPLEAAMRLAQERLGGMPGDPMSDGSATAAVQSLLSRLLVLGPGTPDMDALEDVAPSQPTPVDRDRLRGKKYRTAAVTTAGTGLEGSRLTVGPEGLSWRRARQRETIRTDDVAVIEVWNDDERCVRSRYGYSMVLDPLDWRRWDRIKDAVDSLAPDRVRATGERHPRVTNALATPRFAGYGTAGPYVLAGVVAFTILGIVMVAIRGQSAVEALLGAAIVLVFGAAAFYHTYAVMTGVRRRQRRAASVAPDTGRTDVTR